MAEQLLDGKGGGYRAHVNASNQLSVLAASVHLRHHIAHSHSKAFCLVVQQTPTGAGSCFAYILNDDSVDLNVWSNMFRCAAVECIEIWAVTGTAVGTAVLPVNAVIGSGISATATCVAGNGITGLTKSKLIKRYWVEAAKQSMHMEIGTALILPTGQAIAFYAVTGTTLVDVCTSFDFHIAE